MNSKVDKNGLRVKRDEIRVHLDFNGNPRCGVRPTVYVKPIKTTDRAKVTCARCTACADRLEGLRSTVRLIGGLVR